ncbi:MAG: hypothetical protein WD075_01240 [Rhodospirillales bacterium]
MTQFFVTAFIFSLVVIVQPMVAQAVTLCSSPMRPTCIDVDFTYDDELGMVRCKQDLQRFVDDANKYTVCLQKLIKETKQEITDSQKSFEGKSKKAE